MKAALTLIGCAVGAVAVIFAGYYLGLFTALILAVLTMLGILVLVVIIVTYVVWDAWHTLRNPRDE